MAEEIDYSKYIPAIPLVGAAIAVCYDAGFFDGIGIEYFTLFSLSEHILFSVQAIPIAFAIGLLLIVGDASSIRRQRKRAIAREKALANLEDHPQKLAYLERQLFKARWTFWTAFILTLGFLAFAGFWRVLTIVMVIALLELIEAWAEGVWYTSKVIRAAVTGTAASFLLGSFVASLSVSNSRYVDTLTLKDDQAIVVKLLRSGERGLLIVRSDRPTVDFIRWDDIKGTSRTVRPQVFDLTGILSEGPAVPKR